MKTINSQHYLVFLQLALIFSSNGPSLTGWLQLRLRLRCRRGVAFIHPPSPFFSNSPSSGISSDSILIRFIQKYIMAPYNVVVFAGDHCGPEVSDLTACY